MVEAVFRDAVVVLFIPTASQWWPVVTCEYVRHLMFSLLIERCTFRGIDVGFFYVLSVCGVVVCGRFFVMRHMVCLLTVMPCHLFFHPCLHSESCCVDCRVYYIKL